MNPSQEEALFTLALAKSAAERAAFLERECGSNAALRQRLDALLAAHEQPETLLATQAEAARPTIKLDLADAPDEAVGQTLGRSKLLERVASRPLFSAARRKLPLAERAHRLVVGGSAGDQSARRRLVRPGRSRS